MEIKEQEKTLQLKVDEFNEGIDLLISYVQKSKISECSINDLINKTYRLGKAIEMVKILIQAGESVYDEYTYLNEILVRKDKD